MKNMEFKREMPTSRVIKEMYPLSDEFVKKKAENERTLFLITSDVCVKCRKR